MGKYLLKEIFDFLKSRNITDTESEFSEDWLGQSESYSRKLRSAGKEPSIGAMAVCASRLQKAGYELMSVPRYRPLGEQVLLFSARCQALVNKQSVELDLTP